MADGRQFHFTQCLGSGGFGEVYLARMVSAGGVESEVAVKVLHEGLDPRSQAIQRLRDEGRLLGTLNHPAVLKVLGARRMDLLRQFAIEYLSLGVVAAVVGGLLGLAGAFIVVTFVMQLPWVWTPGTMIVILTLALSLTLIAGFAGAWRVLGRSAGPVLRAP